MSAVVKAVSNVVSDVVDAVGDVGQNVIDLASNAVEGVGKAVEKTVENAIKNPIQTIVTIAAVAAAPATGGASLYAIPATNAAMVLDNGGSLEDAAKAAAISYAAMQVGQQVGTGFEYGTTPFSEQTRMLASQTGDMLSGAAAAVGRTASGATSAALSGGDIQQGIVNTLANYGLRQGIDYTFDAVGNAVDSKGNVILSSTGEGVPKIDPYEVDNVGTRDEADILTGTTSAVGNVIENADGTRTITDDSGSQITVDSNGNVVQTVTSDGQVITPEPIAVPAVDPYEVDNVGTRDEADILTGTQYGVDPYEVDNMGTRNEADILTGTNPDINVFGTVGNYLQNQFINNLTQQILGQNVPKTSLYPTKQIGIPRISSTSDLMSALGYTDPSAFDSSFIATSGPDVFMPQSTDDLRLFNPIAGARFAPQSKISGLPSAISDIINQEYSGIYPGKDTEQRQRAIEEAKSKGWLTDEDVAKLEQNDSAFYDFNPSKYTSTPWMTEDVQTAANGGLIDHNPQFFSEGGAGIQHRYVKGDGDGTSDSVPAMLASGEFVIPADVVSNLGNGDNDAGAAVLDGFMQEIRSHKRSAKPDQLPPDSKGPLSYLKAAQQKKVKKHGRA